MDPANPAPDPQPLGYESPGQVLNLPFTDQRGGLKMMGVVLIVLGGMCGCLTALMPLSVMMPKLAGAQPGLAQQPRLRDLIASLVMLAMGAALLVSIGAGTYRVRRWSRPVAMIILGTWSAMGALAFISWLFFAPSMNKLMQASATTGPAATTMPAIPSFFFVVSGGCMVVFMVALPGGLFWFFKRHSVQQTLDYFDSTPTWTDRCPTSVLAISFWLGFGALMMVGYCTWGVFPAFGRLLYGPPAIASFLACAAVLFVLAKATYRVKPWAWWATMLLVIVGMLSVIVTFLRIDPIEFYRLSGTPAAQIEMFQRAGIGNRTHFIIQQLIYGTAVIGYLIWARRFFTRTPVSI
jgi:hypothetical protein